jgi:hypothetical protein
MQYVWWRAVVHRCWSSRVGRALSGMLLAQGRERSSQVPLHRAVTAVSRCLLHNVHGGGRCAETGQLQRKAGAIQVDGNDNHELGKQVCSVRRLQRGTPSCWLWCCSFCAAICRNASTLGTATGVRRLYAGDCDLGFTPRTAATVHPLGLIRSRATSQRITLEGGAGVSSGSQTPCSQREVPASGRLEGGKACRTMRSASPPGPAWGGPSGQRGLQGCPQMRTGPSQHPRLCTSLNSRRPGSAHGGRDSSGWRCRAYTKDAV